MSGGLCSQANVPWALRGVPDRLGQKGADPSRVSSVSLLALGSGAIHWHPVWKGTRKHWRGSLGNQFCTAEFLVLVLVFVVFLFWFDLVWVWIWFCFNLESVPEAGVRGAGPFFALRCQSRQV